METPILAAAIRGETIESVHRGHIVVVDGDGQRIVSIGDPDTITFFRSAAKPFQAMPLITSGAADEFGFDEAEIAMACASHSGQRRHVELVENMLAKIGLSETDLHCGSHMPFYQPEAERLIRENRSPTQLHNNCSGKHVAMLAVSKHKGWDLPTYEHLEHPLQQEILRIVAEFSEIPVESIRIGIDGCAAPNFAVPVAAMARSFVKLVSSVPFDLLSRITTAVVNHPELIGGTDRLDTTLMQAASGEILSKVGADGAWVCGVFPSERFPNGLGIALKIEDGDDFISRPVVAIDILRQLGILGQDALSQLSPLPTKNRRGDFVGKVVSRFNLS
jgi:L-asparaginase II